MNEQKRKLTIGQIILIPFYLLLWPAIILFISGDWRWTEAWIFGIWFFVTSIAATVYLYVKDPALLNERFRKSGTGNQKAWDKRLVSFIMLIFIAWIVVMPLDGRRFRGIVEFPQVLEYIGGAMLLLSSFFLIRAFTDNTFLSPLVRVQRERNQQIVTTGVYGFVRHPMYLGALLMFIGAPMLMGSFLGIVLGIVLTLLMGVRAVGEEKMLMEEFEEYRSYKQKVKYRFIPYIW